MNNEPIDAKKYKQLFLDNFAIERSSNVTQTLHQPEPQGPVLEANSDFNQTGTQTRCSPQWNSQKKAWEWWYCAFYGELAEARKCHYAISKDGINWETPDLGLYEFNGAGNIPWDIPGEPTSDGDYLYHVILDESSQNKKEKYKGLFGTLHRKIGISSDGLKWEFPDIPKIPSHDESHLTFDEQSNQYIASIKHETQWGRSVYLSTSKNFYEWTEPKLIFHTDEIDNENRIKRIQFATNHPEYLSPEIIDETKGGYTAQVYNMAIMPYHGIYIGFPLIFNPSGPSRGNHDGLNLTELTISRDLHKWDRVANRELFLGLEKWKWDGSNYATAQNLITGRPIIKEDGEIWIYYNGLRFRARPNSPSDQMNEFLQTHKKMTGICLAKLRADGFVSMDAKKQGIIITKPIKINQSKSIHVNIDSTSGYFGAEILDPISMEPLSGYTFENCEKISENSTNKKINWNTTDTINFETVRLKFILEKSSLYSFWTN